MCVSHALGAASCGSAGCLRNELIDEHLLLGILSEIVWYSLKERHISSPIARSWRFDEANRIEGIAHQRNRESAFSGAANH